MVFRDLALTWPVDLSRPRLYASYGARSWRGQRPGPGKALGAAIGELREVAGCVSWGVSTGESLPGVSACVSVGVSVGVVIYW